MWKKFIVLIVIFAVIASGITAFIYFYKNDEISVFMQNKEAKVTAFSDDGKTYISAEDIFDEAKVDYEEKNGKIRAKGRKTLEIDKRNNAAYVNGEKTAYGFKTEKGEIMISPYLAGEIIGTEVALEKDKIYLVDTVPVKVKFRENNREIEFNYSDSMFALSSFEYNHPLAKMSLGASVAAFSSKESDKFWGDKGNFNRDANIISLLKEMGFTNIKTYNYDKSLNDIADSCAFALGEKEAVLDGKKQKIVGIFVRGGAYGNEWVSNFNLDTTEEHQGFSLSAEEIVKTAKSYIGDNPKNTKLWISGFSRGAGIANLTAAKLKDYIGGKNIYAYTFATPNTTSNENRNDKQFGYIFNVISENDLVPLIPPSQWGYGRYGRDVKFPSLLDYSSDAAIKEDIKIGEIYKSISDAGTLSLSEIENSNQSNQVKATVSSIVAALSGRENYVSGISPIMRDFIQIKNTKKKDEKGRWKWVTTKEGINLIFKNEGEKILANAEKDGFLVSAEKSLGEIGQQIKAFGAVCIKNGREPYKVITEEIGVGNLITVASVFVPGAGDTATIAKAHYPETYMAMLLGLSDPDMLKLSPVN